MSNMSNNKESVKLSIGSRLESVTFTEMKRKAYRLSSQGYGVSIIGLSDIEDHVLTITALPERSEDENGDIKKIENVITHLKNLMHSYLAAGLIGEYIGLKVAVKVLLREVKK